MINDPNYTVDAEKWNEARRTGFMVKTCASFFGLLRDWNIRTSGAGSLRPTLMYALRAHKRGKVHCHDMDLAQQAEFLRKAQPMLEVFLVEHQPAEAEPIAPEVEAMA